MMPREPAFAQGRGSMEKPLEYEPRRESRCLYRMTRRHAGIALLTLCLCASGLQASAQTTNLPRITVLGSPFTEHHGGYVISGDFKVDPRMPYVVFPSRALVKDDILSVHPIHLNDNEYLVLQECVSADCSRARLVRVWGHTGALTPVGNSDYRIWITHENKYFIWLKRLPEVSAQSCGQSGSVLDTHATKCRSRFSTFQQISPPLMLIPTGELAAYNQGVLQKAVLDDPVQVVQQAHEGSTYVVTYQGGSVVRVQRMHAVQGGR